MKMKTFEAETMHEALAKVKADLGEDAVILKSRKVSRRSGVKLVDLFEVTAALETDLAMNTSTSLAPMPSAQAPKPEIGKRATSAMPEARPAAAGRVPSYDWRGNLPRVDEQGRSVGEPAKPKGIDPVPAALPVTAKADGEKAQSKFLDMLRSEFRDVKESVEMPTRELRILTDEIRQALAGTQHREPWMQGNESPATVLNDQLLHCGFDRADARRLLIAALSQLPNEATVKEIRQTLRRLLLQEVRCTGGVRFVRGRATRLAVVGPAGAGKTTTLLKLAAVAAIRTGRKVGLLAGDSVRLGAQAQLEAFGRTSGMPVVQVFGPEDLNKAAPHLVDCDLILLDTAGRAPQSGDTDADRQLALVRAFEPDETLLILSATTRARELENQCRRFQAYRPGSLALTRLDECLELGGMHTLTRRTGLPLGYLCDGPSIPEHIQTAKPHHLSHLLLPENTLSPTVSVVGA